MLQSEREVPVQSMQCAQAVQGTGLRLCYDIYRITYTHMNTSNSSTKIKKEKNTPRTCLSRWFQEWSVAAGPSLALCLLLLGAPTSAACCEPRRPQLCAELAKSTRTYQVVQGRAWLSRPRRVWSAEKIKQAGNSSRKTKTFLKKYKA